jgi:hypothetical protein
MAAEQRHVLHVGAKQDVESIADDRDGAQRRVEESVGHHAGDEPFGGAKPARFPDEVA